MKDIVEPNQHKLAAKMLRDIADRQPFQLEIYHEMFPFADQYLIILPSTIRNVLISLLCMTAVGKLVGNHSIRLFPFIVNQSNAICLLLQRSC